MNTFNFHSLLTLTTILTLTACGSDDPAGSTDTASITSESLSSTSSLTTTTEAPTSTMNTVSGATDSGTGSTSSTESDSTLSGSGITDAPTTGSSTGVDEACEDSIAPACTACNAMGQPQRLFGLTWNFASLPGDEPVLGIEELRCIDPETGASDLIAQIPGMDWLYFSLNTYDREAKILYAFAFANADQVDRIFSIHTITGELMANPPVENNWIWMGGIHARSDNAVVTIVWDGIAQEQFRTLDPATGKTSFVASIPELGGLFAGINAYDRSADVLYAIGQHSAKEGTHLFLVDAMKGNLIHSSTFPQDHTWLNIFIRKNGQLVGLVSDGMVKLLAIDSNTAMTEVVGEIQDAHPLHIGAAEYDDITDMIFFVDEDSHLVQIDAASGEILGNLKLAKPPFENVEYNWSGGIHLR